MFADAQKLHEDNPEFYAPDLSVVELMILRGDLIKVCEQNDDDGEDGERYWVKVESIDWPTIQGTVANDLVIWDREHGSKITVEARNIYDFEMQDRFVGTQTDRNLPSVGKAEVHSDDSGAAQPLDPRYDLRNHSPDGFAWGYGGSGPAQLALAILAHVTDDETAQKHYQAYKFSVIGRLKGNWQITAQEVKDWLKAKEAAA